MTSLLSTRAPIAWGSALLICLASVTACGESEPGDPPHTNTETTANDGASTAAGSAVVTTLDDDQRADCMTVFNQQPIAADNLVIIADPTASARPMRMPPALASQISATSEAGGSVSLVMVNGPDAAPTVVLKRAALSTPGDRSAPSVERIADMAPRCIADQMATHGPTAPDTDLYSAVALGAELVDKHSTVWLLSDMESNAGQLDLTHLVTDPYETAATRAAKNAPIDFRHRPLHVAGIANSASHPDAAARVWIAGFTTALCVAWNATGCEDIALEPGVTTPVDTSELPDDAAITFPTITRQTGPTSRSASEPARAGVTSSASSTTGPAPVCTWSVPAALTFAGDSATLRSDAGEILEDPIEVMKANPDARLTITGHTPSSTRYTEDELVDLSKDRAASAAQAFYDAGIERGRVRTRGAGDTDPLGPHTDPDTGLQIPGKAAKERRVDLTIIGAQC